MAWELPAHEERCYAAIESRDDRFDGWFIVGVRTTGIYCRPSCPTPVRPKRANVAYFSTPAAAQRAGFRACKRCRPDATPASPEWNLRSDLVGRAMRLIGDGLVDRAGVTGLAAELGVSGRHLHRLLLSEIGAGPLAIARAHRANTARTLIETTSLPFAEVAFAAGFSSIRQFNDTVRDVFGTSPTALRQVATPTSATPGLVRVRLPFRRPLDADQLVRWHRLHAVPGVWWSEPVDGPSVLRRTLRLPNGGGSVRLEVLDDHVSCELWLEQIADLGTAVARCRQLLDLDADPRIVQEALAGHGELRPLVTLRPGMRVPGAVDGFEAAVLAVVSQQVHVRTAVTLAARLVQACGDPLGGAPPGRRLFPRPQTLAEADLGVVGLTEARADALRALSTACATGLRIDRGVDRHELRARLSALAGIGRWTADIVALRAVGDPDVLPERDHVIGAAAARWDLADSAKALADRSPSWSPWRSYLAHHLWASASASPPLTPPQKGQE